MLFEKSRFPLFAKIASSRLCHLQPPVLFSSYSSSRLVLGASGCLLQANQMVYRAMFATLHRRMWIFTVEICNIWRVLIIGEQQPGGKRKNFNSIQSKKHQTALESVWAWRTCNCRDKLKRAMVQHCPFLQPYGRGFPATIWCWRQWAAKVNSPLTVSRKLVTG